MSSDTLAQLPTAPLLMVATLWYAVLTSLLDIGRHFVEKHYARGTGDAR